jgi:hypothetical protein
MREGKPYEEEAKMWSTYSLSAHSEYRERRDWKERHDSDEMWAEMESLARLRRHWGEVKRVKRRLTIM